MKRLLFLLTLLLSGTFSSRAAIRARYDERIELISTICKLADFPEYNMDMSGDYCRELEAWFAPVKGHPAVTMMRRLRNRRQIAFDAPMAYAVHMHKEGERFSMIDAALVPEERWAGADLAAVADTITDFYRQSNFARFFNDHRPFYESVCKAYDDAVIADFHQEWYERFYGYASKENFEVIIGLTNGGANYGASRQLPGKRRDIYAIVGYSVLEDGRSCYSASPQQYLNTLVHEFNHSFIDILAGSEQYRDRMSVAGKRLLQYTQQVMAQQAYPQWEQLVNESLVRASVICYLMDNRFTKETIRQAVIDEMSVGFYWMPELVQTLKEYRRDRSRYPTFEAFYPRLTDFFDRCAANRSESLDAIFQS